MHGWSHHPSNLFCSEDDDQVSILYSFCHSPHYIFGHVDNPETADAIAGCQLLEFKKSGIGKVYVRAS